MKVKKVLKPTSSCFQPLGNKSSNRLLIQQPQSQESTLWEYFLLTLVSDTNGYSRSLGFYKAVKEGVPKKHSGFII